MEPRPFGSHSVVAACQRYIDRTGTRDFTEVDFPRNPIIRRLELPGDFHLQLTDLLAYAIVADQAAPESKYVIVVRGGCVVAAIPTDKYGGLLAVHVSPKGPKPL